MLYQGVQRAHCKLREEGYGLVGRTIYEVPNHGGRGGAFMREYLDDLKFGGKVANAI